MRTTHISQYNPKLPRNKMKTTFFAIKITVFVTVIFGVIKAEQKSVGDYIVDCSGCAYTPLPRVDSYSCNVRCEAQGTYIIL